MNAAYQVTNYNNNIACYKYRWLTWGSQEELDQMQYQLMDGSFGMDNCPNNVIVLRYADVLLMFVEADMLLGGAKPNDLTSTGASDYAIGVMNQILYRARNNKTEAQMWEYATDTWGFYRYDTAGKPIPVAEGDKYRYLKDYNKTDNPLTFKELSRQRSCELCFEFHRYNDLLRWGMLSEMVESRVFDPQYVKEERVKPYHYLFPIPIDVIQASPNKTGFYQNPNY